MMRIIILCLFLLPLCAISQHDTIIIVYPKEPQLMAPQPNDTILINSPMDGQILFGTMALPSTSSQVALYSYSGLWLESVIGSDCNGHDEDKMGVDKIESILMTDTTWILATQITSNCCHKFLGDAALENDSIINLSYIGYGGNCACYCCFGLTYTFKKEDGEWFSDYKWVMINNDRKTLIRIPEDRK
jgi:hypothetical protein